jgi:hypothetical protein
MSSKPICLAALVVACSSGAAPPANVTKPEVASGSRAVAALTLWPERWPRVQATAVLLRPVLGPEVELAGPSLWATLRPLADRAALERLALPPPGLDPAAPISIEVFAPAESFEVTAAALARAFASHQAPTNLPSPRVRVTFPASDAKALADALRAAAGRNMRVVPGDRAVALDVVFAGAPTGDLDPPVVATLFDPGGASAARAMLRVDGLGDLSAAIGMARMAGALGDVDPARRQEMLSFGTAELITGYLVIDPNAAVASEALVEVPAGDEPPRIAFALTDAGVTTLTAGGFARGKTTPVTQVQWSAAVAAAPKSPLLASILANPEGKKRKYLETDVLSLFHECGPMCFLYVGLGNGIQFASAIDLTSMTGRATTALANAEVTWTAANLVFVHPAGKPPTNAWKRSTAAAASPASACYRKALIAVRAELRQTSHDAKSALDAAASCVQGDSAIAARHKAIGEFVGAVSR